MSGKYPNTFYRVSAKAIIRNDKGEDCDEVAFIDPKTLKGHAGIALSGSEKLVYKFASKK